MTFREHVFYELVAGLTLIVYAPTEQAAETVARFHSCLIQAARQR